MSSESLHEAHAARPDHFIPVTNRRDFLLKAGTGFGALALADLFSRTAEAYSLGSAKTPHHPPRAKSVIFLFMEGGPSHLDLFDPKPDLSRLAGQRLPASFGSVLTPMGEADSPLLADQRKWKQHGEAGTWVSDWLPHTAEIVDDIAVIRSCMTDGINHSGGVMQMNTCSPVAGRPSLGAWVTYGLGTDNGNLPAFAVMQDTDAIVTNGPRNWGGGFMPAEFQGTPLGSGDQPIAHLKHSDAISDERQRRKLVLLDRLNRRHAESHQTVSELEARIRSYELAFRMQAEAPEAVDLSTESAETQRLYGMDEKHTAKYGRMCLLARRLVERGVRFIQLYHGAGSAWDAHADIEGNHGRMCPQMDKPVAGLVKDLKRRGLLDETLVVWGGEFGRTPMSEKGNGRDHDPYGFTMWMAGGGVIGGQTLGRTDELGLRAVEDHVHVRDLHATILYLMGLDHMLLEYIHKGRPERPTINEGTPFAKLFTPS